MPRDRADVPPVTKGVNPAMKNILNTLRENFIFACEAYCNTFLR